ncbi:MAG: tetratricopeptide repeat protein [Flavobacteriales bacterium]|nr:tetratricopeptide repeat protein [Flavobacteriales bacterium]
MPSRPRLPRLLCAAILLALASRPCAQDQSRLQACVDSCSAALSAGAYDLAMEQADEAMSIALTLEDSSAVAEVLVKRSSIRMMRGDYNSSLRDLQRALRIYEVRKDEAGLATVYTSMGSIHYYDRNYARAQEYYLKSLAIRTRSGKPGEVATLYGNIGSVLEEMGRPDSALAYHRHHLSIRRSLGHASWIPVCYTNLGACFDKLGPIGQCPALPGGERGPQWPRGCQQPCKRIRHGRARRGPPERGAAIRGHTDLRASTRPGAGAR